MKNRAHLDRNITLSDFVAGIIALSTKRLLRRPLAVSGKAGRYFRQQEIGQEFSHLSCQLKWDKFGNLLDDCK